MFTDILLYVTFLFGSHDVVNCRFRITGVASRGGIDWSLP
jgi:hypothetical protein